MILTRRLFIFGTAAALALPAVNKIVPVGADSAIVKREFQAAPQSLRSIRELFFSNGDAGIARATVSIGQRPRDPLLSFTIGPNGFLVWKAAPIVLLKDETLRLDVAPCGVGARAELVYEADGKNYSEIFDFARGSRATIPHEV